MYRPSTVLCLKLATITDVGDNEDEAETGGGEDTDSEKDESLDHPSEEHQLLNPGDVGGPDRISLLGKLFDNVDFEDKDLADITTEGKTKYGREKVRCGDESKKNTYGGSNTEFLNEEEVEEGTLTSSSRILINQLHHQMDTILVKYTRSNKLAHDKKAELASNKYRR